MPINDHPAATRHPDSAGAVNCFIDGIAQAVRSKTANRPLASAEKYASRVARGLPDDFKHIKDATASHGHVIIKRFRESHQQKTKDVPVHQIKAIEPRCSDNPKSTRADHLALIKMRDADVAAHQNSAL